MTEMPKNELPQDPYSRFIRFIQRSEMKLVGAVLFLAIATYFLAKEQVDQLNGFHCFETPKGAVKGMTAQELAEIRAIFVTHDFLFRTQAMAYRATTDYADMTPTEQLGWGALNGYFTTTLIPGQLIEGGRTREFGHPRASIQIIRVPSSEVCEQIEGKTVTLDQSGNIH